MTTLVPTNAMVIDVALVVVANVCTTPVAGATVPRFAVVLFITTRIGFGTSVVAAAHIAACWVIAGIPHPAMVEPAA